ncbi:MAG TPA: DUF6125 family protein [Syntrophales bacterium]|nr:DUF6125 family protein [Syntrophales bacterium]HQN78426.1 DUF6125 family protein [Syntrophales bacterium]HQQ27200.1 DUF6125 family protein [Syntrophales bacterium]
MDRSVFRDMGGEELGKYIEFLLWHYRVMDAFWFLEIAEMFDQKTAEEINRRVWGRIPTMAAKDLIGRFGIREKGLRGFVKALRYFPWTILIGYEIEEKEDEVVLRVPRCATQEARKKRGLPEYDCGDMHRGEFESFAGVIDERIRVACDFAPPGPHPDNLYCQWRFRLGE